MGDFRDAVKQVQTAAAQGDVAALEKTLLDAGAERAARFAAANFLSRAGEPGLRALQAGVQCPNPVTRAASVYAYLPIGAPDADFLIAAAHSSRRLGRIARRVAAHLDDPALRLRCFLPSPFHREPDPLPHLEEWAFFDWKGVVGAIGRARYAPGVPLLILLLDGTDEQIACASYTLRQIGVDARAALGAARPQSQRQRENIEYALKVFRFPLFSWDIPRLTRPLPVIWENLREQYNALCLHSPARGAADV